jgi:GT2 family glycosyltransferase
MSVAAAVVTYNRKDVLRQCLCALLSQTLTLDEVIVVDNASSDGTAAMVEAEFPSVRLVQMGENTGAAGGFAEGLRHGVARGHDWVWVFNDDDMAAPHALATMLRIASQLPEATGILACGRDDENGNRYVLGSRWRHRHIPIELTDPLGHAVSLDVVTFSGTLVSASLVQHVGLPKREFFMMSEDLEFCLRVRRAGWQIYAIPTILVKAFAMGSAGQTPPWRGYYQTRNHLAMTLEHRSGQELFWWVVRTVKFCLAALRHRDHPVERIRLRSLGAWHAVCKINGRTISPTTAR